jgi:hypothetical protein
MNVQTHYTTPSLPFGSMSPQNGPPAIDRVVLRHLKTESEIEAVLHLREEIDLSAHYSAGNFASLEKKETNWGLSVLSS